MGPLRHPSLAPRAGSDDKSFISVPHDARRRAECSSALIRHPPPRQRFSAWQHVGASVFLRRLPSAKPQAAGSVPGRSTGSDPPRTETPRHAQILFAQLVVAHADVETQTRMLLRIVAVQCGGGQEGFQRVAVLPRSQRKRHAPGRSERGIGQGAVDLRLYQGRFIVIRAAASGQEVELMTVTARPMTGAGIARVEPERETVGAAGPGDVSLRQFVFAVHRHLHAETKFVPRQGQVGELLPLARIGEVVEPIFRGQIEQTIPFLPPAFPGDSGMDRRRGTEIGRE